MKVYFDNAASTALDPDVFEHMKPFLLEHFGNPSSSHAHGRQLRAAIEAARKRVAECVGVQSSEIFFTGGGTEADNMAIKGAVEAFDLNHIIYSAIEHHAVSHSAEELEAARKVSLTKLSVDAEGRISLEDLRAALETNPKSLVSVMHGNNEIGTLNDLNAIGDLAHEYGAYFHSDTVQTMGSTRINLSELPVDFAAASAHKFYGPKGTGFLYIRKGLRIPSMIVGGGQERNMRAGTENVAGIVGLSFALEKCILNLDKKVNHLLDLKHYLKDQLIAEFPGVSFNGDQDPDGSIPTVLNVTFPTEESEGLLLFKLDMAGISASGGSACNSGAVKGSFVLGELGLSSLQTTNSIRFSFGMNNTRQEVDYLLSKLREIIPVQVQ